MAMTNLIKYPRTYHLPWSEGVTSDDKINKSTNQFVGKRVIVTEKMDGENTSIYKDAIHARSLDGRNHPSRNWVKGFAQSFQYLLDDDVRLCGENLYAKHSIAYEALPSYFLGFSVWNNTTCISWDASCELMAKCGVLPVPVLYDGEYDEKLIKTLYDGIAEGYVIRLADSITRDDFKTSVGKFVRQNHVQTDVHWMQSEVIKNKIK